MKNNKKGITILEIMLSIALLGLIGITVLTSLSYSIQTVGRTGRSSADTIKNRSIVSQRTFDTDYSNGDILETPHTVGVAINLSSGTITRTIEGYMIETGEGNTEIDTFVPKIIVEGEE